MACYDNPKTEVYFQYICIQSIAKVFAFLIKFLQFIYTKLAMRYRIDSAPLKIREIS